FARMTAGPLLGSPRCAESVMHAGNPGRGANLVAAIVVTPGLSWLPAHNPIHATSPAVMVIFRNKYILFFSPHIPQNARVNLPGIVACGNRDVKRPLVRAHACDSLA